MADTPKEAPQILDVVGRRLKDDARSAEDDWSGLSSAAERRRIQNRINARAHRRRKAVERRAQREGAAGAVQGPSKPKDLMPKPTYAPPTELEWSRREQVFWYYQRPNTDHHLNLVAFNTFRAWISNISILGFSTISIMQPECNSPFWQGETGDSLPENFKPTAIQKRTRHHRLFDTFPLPEFRDIMIKFHQDTICPDLANEEPHPDSEYLRGFIVWGEPYLSDSWEISEEYFRFWFELLKDCTSLINSSNKWREMRGEPPLGLGQASSLPLYTTIPKLGEIPDESWQIHEV